MTQAFYSGISGIKTYSTSIDVVSDNLANISTVGFRGYSAEFSSLFEEQLQTTNSLASFDDTVGIGTKIQSTAMLQATGTFMQSDKSTDLAINGNGWFAIQGYDSPIYTRDGNFNFDKNRDLVNKDGLYVLGTVANNISADNILTKQQNSTPLGDVTQQQKLRFPETLTYPSEATTQASFYSNLGVEDTTRTISTTVVNAQGEKRALRLEFNKVPTQTSNGLQWNVKATIQSLDNETVYSSQNGTLSFSPEGALIANTLTDIDNDGTKIDIDLGNDYSGIVSINTPVVSGSSKTNGTIGGDLVGYEINSDAEILATFSNGMQSSIGRVGVFHFKNEQGLERISGSMFKESVNSGNPLFYKDAKGDNIIGTGIMNHRLEGSNYSLEVGLTDLIIYQRAYDANSKSISTADEMMQKALSMDA